MRIDCHVHTYRSGDSRAPVSRVLEAARRAGIGVLCITDHGTIEGALEAARVATEISSSSWQSRRGPGGDVAVIVGQECRTWAGEIIGLFLNERIPGNLQPREVVARIEDQGGLVYVPHPFCPDHNGVRRDVLEELVSDGAVDIVEVHNAKAQADANEKAAAFAVAHGLAQAAASDAHYPEFVGRAFVEVEGVSVEEITSDPRRFLEALSRGRLHRGTYTYADARWQKRV